MKQSLIFKLALTNIKKNLKLIIPFTVTCIIATAMFFITATLSQNDSISNMHSGNTIHNFLFLGTIIIAIFTAVFLFYTYSFLIKRRQKELGLYNVLGMEKRHISKILTYETAIIGFAGTVLGILFGMVFGRLTFMVLIKISKSNIPIEYGISVPAIIITALLAFVIFSLIIINSLRQIHFLNPSQLMNESNRGEKEPKTKWIFAMLSILCICSGYIISFITKDIRNHNWAILTAVVLVAAGTYFLFIAGSITLLKLLKKNKKYYYKSNHFIAVSGMIYRMKQNAVGLANICILSTAVILLLSTTICMYAGTNDSINAQSEYDISLKQSGYYVDYGDIESQIDAVLDENNAHITSSSYSESISIYSNYSQNNFTTATSEEAPVCNVVMTTVDNFNALAKSNYILSDTQALVWTNLKNFDYPSIDIQGNHFDIGEVLTEIPSYDAITLTNQDIIFVVVKNHSVLDQLLNENELTSVTPIAVSNEYYGEWNYNLDVSDEVQLKIVEELKSVEPIQFMLINSKAETKYKTYEIYGGMFFVGAFLSILFIMATVLIIYYKQISEGYEDKRRFKTMKKIGLDNREITRSVKSQIITVFLLPLITAVVHVVAAFPIITKLLQMMYLSNITLFAVCTSITVAIFAVTYIIVYAITARTYYKIVE